MSEDRLTLDDSPSRDDEATTLRRGVAEARPDDDRAEAEDSRRREKDLPRDDGHTSGGGSLGHDQPDDVVRDTRNRNATGSLDDPPSLASDSKGELRRGLAKAPRRSATGAEADPVMPQDDATLKTKI